ncbi:MAG: class I SAM-dependent methyltransferase [Myxococcota bacterium]
MVTFGMDPNLEGVPETMLWTLHNRANEALRSDGVLRDEKCVEIYRSLNYDYERSFGEAEPSHGVRSAVFDELIRQFIKRHPEHPIIVNLGEGLETQRFRFVDDPALWIAVDVPEAIAIRERFIEPDARHRHVAVSALDFAWMDEVPPNRPVFFTAQGLLMYFAEDDVQRLVAAIAARFPGSELAFDHIPPWFSKKTTSEEGFNKTPHYRAPPMPWGLKVSEVVPKLREWAKADVAALGPVAFRFPRGPNRWLVGLMAHVPILKDHMPGITHIRFESTEE